MRGSGIKFSVIRKPNQWDQAPILAGSGMHFSRTKKTIGGVRKLFITYFLNAIILSVRKWENNWSRDVYSLVKSWSLHVWQKCLTLLRVRAHFWPGLLFIVCSRNFSWVTPHIISWLIFDDDTFFGQNNLTMGLQMGSWVGNSEIPACFRATFLAMVKKQVIDWKSVENQKNVPLAHIFHKCGLRFDLRSIF